ncbi:hypothetical protein [Ancylobacter sp. IITR112]|uniref:hypothetical protein n=1 Tax=Ancylobacter sp. IITR112 TaxID=3138073 RepID=UPI00352A00B0
MKDPAPPGPLSTHRPARRIRAARSEEREEIIARRTAALRPFLGPAADEAGATLHRLLRAERRAARSGMGYDPARHAALARLLAEAEAVSRAGAAAGNEKGRHRG